MWYATGSSDISDAIIYTATYGFQAVTGDRECVPNYLVVLTKVMSNYNKALTLKDELNANDIQLIVLNLNNLPEQDDIGSIPENKSISEPVQNSSLIQWKVDFAANIINSGTLTFRLVSNSKSSLVTIVYFSLIQLKT